MPLKNKLTTTLTLSLFTGLLMVGSAWAPRVKSQSIKKASVNPYVVSPFEDDNQEFTSSRISITTRICIEFYKKKLTELGMTDMRLLNQTVNHLITATRNNHSRNRIEAEIRRRAENYANDAEELNNIIWQSLSTIDTNHSCNI